MTMKDKSNLIWIDLEMTGLDTQMDHIIEIATIVTDKNLNILAEVDYMTRFLKAQLMRHKQNKEH